MFAIVRPGEGHSGLLSLQNRTHQVMIGGGGIRQNKSEGDHATPVGILPLRHVFYRADRVLRPRTDLRVEALSPQDGWCDDPSHAAYNRAVSLPYPAHHERLWRDDHCYDLCVVLGWNDDPVVPDRGSAIFLHLPPESGVTEGCIAMNEPLLRDLLAAGVTALDIRAA